MSKVAVLIASILIVCTGAIGQSNVPDNGANAVYFAQGPAGAPGPVLPPPDVAFRTQLSGENATVRAGFVGGFIGAGDVQKPLTGAPYSATANTEITQVLADGNRIVNKTSAFVARDSQGRTRREESLGSIGPLAVNGPKLAFITDPVSKSNYILDLNNQSATVIKTDGIATAKQVVTNGPGTVVQRKVFVSRAPAGGEEQRIVVLNSANDSSQVKTESLGTQIIGGVAAEGKRTTRTIPAGQIGNERPLQITSEVWTSPDLQIVVLSKRNDPRFGETVYSLSDIKRAEPDASLFEVPSNFKVTSVAPNFIGVDKP